MKIAGFNIGKKGLIAIGVIILVIVISSVAKSKKEEDEINKRMAEQESREAAAEAEASLGGDSNGELSISEEMQLEHDNLQEALQQVYGVAPDGFEWDEDGELIPLSSEDLTVEDLVYGYLRALSILDFYTAQKYSKHSLVINTYKSLYDSTDEANYFQDFHRKQLKYSLTTLEILGIDDTALFADGTEFVTVRIKSLDLTNKDFWLDDKDKLFKTLKVFDTTESDTTKRTKYIYDYIYKCYLEGKVPKKEWTVELTLEKGTKKGWLVSDDSELLDILNYSDGLNIEQYISDCYADWLEGSLEQDEAERERIEAEREAELERQEEEREKELEKNEE